MVQPRSSSILLKPRLTSQLRVSSQALRGSLAQVVQLLAVEEVEVVHPQPHQVVHH